MSQEDTEKPFAPSQKRLDEAHARGEVIKSIELTGAAGYGGLILVFLVGGGAILGAIGQISAVLLSQADRLAPLTSANGAPFFAALAQNYGVALAPLFLAPAGAVLISLFGQKAWTFAPEKLAPKWSRISPFASAAQKFGKAGLVDFAKNAAKMVFVGALLTAQLSSRASEIIGASHISAAQSTVLMLDILLQFLALVLVISVVFGGADYLWQYFQFMQKNRMSRQEMMDEVKDSEGDAHVKQARRQRGHDIATNQMMQEVSGADVVIVNPTHYAVALKWNRAKGGAPICVAKGVDEIAARIRERAKAAQVPLHSDPPTARALFASVALGAEIAPEHYRSVAAAIRFADRMRKVAGKGQRT